MKRDRLKPYVYKVEGPVNFALYDMLNGEFHHFSPHGSVDELRKVLLDMELIFETEGAVPNKIVSEDMRDMQDNLTIRVLQIRLNGKGEDNCWNREKKKGVTRYIQNEVLKSLISNCRYIPVHKVRIEAEEEDRDKIKEIVREFKCNKFEFYIERGLNPKAMEEYRKNFSGKEIVNSEDGKKKLKALKVEIFNFFYARHFNPCLGHQVAIDTAGEIKCCLWSEEILGNIKTDNLKDMIIRGQFDKYWEYRKEMIEVCKDCELRFACDDCRIYALKEGGKMSAKPSYCRYDPYNDKSYEGFLP